MKATLKTFSNELEEELKNILAYWIRYAVDDNNGGFYGKIDNNNHIDANAPKGSVLNSRILWSFSAAYNVTKTRRYLDMADRAFSYLSEKFIDQEFGGVYWTVDCKGRPLDTKKQTYALAFAVYGLSEYYKSSGNEAAKKMSIDLYHTLLRHSYDSHWLGYFESFARDWKEINDNRLSEKDANEKKSMNTHLHVLEGLSNLYTIWPDETLREKIRELAAIFLDHIIHPRDGHLTLFFDEKWTPRSTTISYGHDIEASWLMQESTQIINDAALLEKIKIRSTLVADAAATGIDHDGGLWYEYDKEHHHLIAEKHWWPQAEAMVGFFNVWQNTGRPAYLEKCVNNWAFIKQFILDEKNGEWYWGVTERSIPMSGQDKAGLWKCPYHNSRACMQIISRIAGLKGLHEILPVTKY